MKYTKQHKEGFSKFPFVDLENKPWGYITGILYGAVEITPAYSGYSVDQHNFENIEDK